MPFLTDVLSRVISVLPHVKTDIHRYAWAHALRTFCESVREYVSASNSTKVEYDHNCSVVDTVGDEQVTFN